MCWTSFNSRTKLSFWLATVVYLIEGISFLCWKITFQRRNPNVLPVRNRIKRACVFSLPFLWKWVLPRRKKWIRLKDNWSGRFAPRCLFSLLCTMHTPTDRRSRSPVYQREVLWKQLPPSVPRMPRGREGWRPNWRWTSSIKRWGKPWTKTRKTPFPCVQIIGTLCGSNCQEKWFSIRKCSVRPQQQRCSAASAVPGHFPTVHPLRSHLHLYPTPLHPHIIIWSEKSQNSRLCTFINSASTFCSTSTTISTFIIANSTI